MAAPERDQGVHVVEIRGSNGPEDGLDVIEPRRRISGLLVIGAVALLAVGGVVGWLAGHTQRAPASVVTLALAVARRDGRRHPAAGRLSGQRARRSDPAHPI